MVTLVSHQLVPQHTTVAARKAGKCLSRPVSRLNRTVSTSKEMREGSAPVTLQRRALGENLA